MLIDLYGLTFETPRVTFYLRWPWRATALEHRLFEAIRHLPRARCETAGDEARVHVIDPKTWHAAQEALARILKGWQEEAALGSERRSWRWLLETNVDAHGYDDSGAQASLWGFLQLTLEQGAVQEPRQPEDIDLDCLELQIWGCASP